MLDVRCDDYYITIIFPSCKFYQATNMKKSRATRNLFLNLINFLYNNKQKRSVFPSICVCQFFHFHRLFWFFFLFCYFYSKQNTFLSLIPLYKNYEFFFSGYRSHRVYHNEFVSGSFFSTGGR